MHLRLYSEQMTRAQLLAMRNADGPYLQAVRTRLDSRRAALGLHLPVELELVQRVELSKPSSFDDASALLTEAAQLGVDAIRLWPQLSREEGLFLNLDSAARFFDRLHAMLDAMPSSLRSRTALLFDLEPPIQRFSNGLNTLTSLNLSSKQTATLGLRRRLETVTERTPNATHVAAIFLAPSQPLQLLYEHLMATPSEHEGQALFGELDAMAYGSLLAYFMPRRWAMGALGARWVRRLAAQHYDRCARLQARGSMILGCISTGALGNEPCYAHPRELAMAARAAGSPWLARLGLFEVAGLFHAPNGEPRDWALWTDALLGIAPGLERLRRPNWQLRTKTLQRHFQAAASELGREA
ncbi:MAG: hypothetical protein RBU37_11165 [Myxococcota bacterium]|nr:hypothetical protein [Myxococcota bacterium]